MRIWKESAKETEAHGVKLSRIGGWIDLAIYYAGSDGNAWSYQSGHWTNMGELEAFKARLAKGFYRGELEASGKVAA